MIQAIPTSVTSRLLGCGRAEQLEGVVARHRGQAGHHEHVGDDDRPAALPAEPRAHRARHPGERRAAVRVGPVHVVVGGGDAGHREERHQHHRGRVHAQTRDRGDEPERRRQAVGRRGRGHSDHDVRDERDRVLLQALVLDLNARAGGLCDGRALHWRSLLTRVAAGFSAARRTHASDGWREAPGDVYTAWLSRAPVRSARGSSGQRRGAGGRGHDRAGDRPRPGAVAGGGAHGAARPRRRAGERGGRAPRGRAGVRAGRRRPRCGRAGGARSTASTCSSTPLPTASTSRRCGPA